MPIQTADKKSRHADLPAQARRLAEKLSADAGERLTPARLNAYAELVAQGRPVSAYELMALLEKREKRRLAPLTVYRQLEFLTRIGLVHKLASAQAFLACDHPDHPHDGLYLVCSTCGHADELESTALTQLLGKAASSRGFKSNRRIVELEGTCKNCADDPPKS
ncbi:Fur family transcriptional regulator [Panacagrimonas sp.]|uniref:Fur family transcriptional regulator n=1 Tax=Panacagrimonas sp. TaxID=2480088 RepID=UPI003B52B41F